jgi:hypothetical protein
MKYTNLLYHYARGLTLCLFCLFVVLMDSLFGTRLLSMSNTALTYTITNRNATMGPTVTFARDGSQETAAPVRTMTLTSSSATYACTNTQGLIVGMLLTGTNVGASAAIQSINPNVSIIATVAASGSGTEQVTCTAATQQTVGAAYQPYAASALYLNLGTVNSATITTATQDIPVKAATGGFWGRNGTLNGEISAAWSADFQSVNELVCESIFRAASPITLGQSFTPFRQPVPITGWLQITFTDQQGVQMVAAILRCEIKFSNLEGKEGVYMHPGGGPVYPQNALNYLDPLAWTAYQIG